MRACFKIQSLLFATFFLGFRALATTYYVDVNSTNPAPPYTSWSTASTDIQSAIDQSSTGDTVLVNDGVYQSGGYSFNGSNRVYVVSGVTVQSVNGPAVTTIVGCPATTNQNDALRCVFLSQFSTLSGFTLTNGAAQGVEADGGGVNAQGNSTVTNCIIIGNIAENNGGGYYSSQNGLIINSRIIENTATNGGAGTYGGTLINCLVQTNSGGGEAGSTAYNCLFTGNTGVSAAGGGRLINCTVTGNSSGIFGAANGSVLINSIIYYNNSGSYSDCYQCRLTNCCTTIGLGTSLLSNGSISNSPGFVSLTGDYHLLPWSHCVDAGNSAFITNSTDLDGNPRIVGAAVDMGCYENQGFQGTAHFVSLSSTNPAPPYTNWMTAATNIQDAVAIAQTGEYVIVGDGTYTNGGTVMYGAETNRLVLTNAITLMGADGARAVVISGGPQMRCVYVGSNAVLADVTVANGNVPGSGDITNEESGGGVWCVADGIISNCIVVNNSANPSAGLGGGIFGGTVYNTIILGNQAAYGAVALATLSGCIIQSNCWLNGSYCGGLAYGIASNCIITANRSGGGGVAYKSWLYDCLISSNSYYGGASFCTNYDCTFSGNSGYNGGGAAYSVSYGCMFTGNTAQSGGGTYLGTNLNCNFNGNSASSAGGGAYGGISDNCLFAKNNGGGIYNATLDNCTVVSNTASGINEGAATNCIIYYNGSTYANNAVNTKRLANTCTFPQITAGQGNFTNPPSFVNLAANDFHLQSNSPCINSGNNAYVASATDLDGNPRIMGGTVDIGCYEYQTPQSVISYAYLQQYGLPTDGSVDSADLDGTGFNVYQDWLAGLNPTNPVSILVMLPVTTTNIASGVTVTWQSVSGIPYNLQRSTNLSVQPPFSTIQSNITGQAGTTSYTDTSATNSMPYFYRVGVP